jgi:tetratricopeptide (TPR) repeat protein
MATGVAGMLPVVSSGLILLGVLLALGGAAVWGGLRGYRAVSARTIRACVATDQTFRFQWPDWDYRIKLWFAEANRAFERSGVRWETIDGGNAYAEDTQGSVAQRRTLMEGAGSCQADVVLGFTGLRDKDTKVSVAPFQHTLLVATEPGEPDAIAVLALSRALANLFGAPVNPDALIATDAPQGEVLDAAALNLVHTLRDYDFSAGTSALRGKWEQRAQDALVEALASSTPAPVREAHRTLARAFAAARKYPESIAHMREAVRSAPGDSFLRIELALALRNDSQNEAAVTELKEAADLDSEDARPHAIMGAIYQDQLRMYDSIHEFRLATRLDPRSAEYFTALGNALSTQAGRSEEAAAAFQAALRLNPRDPKSASGAEQIASARRLAEDELKNAQIVERNNPRSADARMRVALAEIHAGHVEMARQAFEAAISIEPANGQAHLALSRLAFDRGDYATAEQELESARRRGARIPSGFASALERRMGPVRSFKDLEQFPGSIQE